MEFDGARSWFEKVDTNGDGVIDQKEFSQRASNMIDEGIGSSSSNRIGGGFSTINSGGGSTDFGTDASYEAVSGYKTGTDKVYDRINLNRNNVIERREFNQFVNGESAHADRSSITNYVSRYQTDSRGFFLDPNPEIFTRPNPSPVPTYTRNIIIRYLQPPPLPPSGVSYFFVTLLFVLSINQELIHYRKMSSKKCARLL
jgi:hypothetical protein